MRIVLSLIFLAFSSICVAGQLDEKKFSSIQIVNAASTGPLRLQIGEKVWYPTIRSGQTTSAGAFPQLDWTLCLLSFNEGTEIESRFKAGPGKSYIAVIVGDFEKLPEKDVSARPLSNTISSMNAKIRAKILFLPNEVGSGEGHRIRIVNGLVDTPIHFSLPASDPTTAAYGETRSLSRLPAMTELRVETGGKVFNLSFLFVPPESGCTIAFYREGDQIRYVTANEVILQPDGSLPSASQEEIERVLKQFEDSAQ
jgi:hypothetical protein